MDPNCYSFKKISEKNGVCIYYTNPTKSKQYTDSDEIIEYYDNALKQIGNKTWIWIFDSDGFDMKHALDIKTGTGIAELLTNKYAKNLVEIKIINPTWHIKAMLKAVIPFLDKVLCNKIKVLKDRYYSVIEFV
jgi:hypothetical protein